MLGLFVILFSLFLSSCVIHQSGASSRQMKKQLLRSFLYQNSEFFYPTLPIQPDSLPLLDDKHRKSINKELTAFSDLIYKLALNEQQHMQQLFGRTLNKPIKIHPDAVNYRTPYVRSEPTGFFRFDIQVTQAIFRASILEGLQASQFSLMGEVSNELTEKKNKGTHTQQDPLTSFLQQREKIKHARARGRVGDLIHSFRELNDDSFNMESGNPSSWFGMNDIIMKSMSTEYLYTTTILFVFSHEMGHFVLNHFNIKIPAGPDSCRIAQQQELDADKYATFLMYRVFGNNFSLELMSPNLFGFDRRTLIGDKAFLTDAYILAKFNDAGAVCLYPTAPRREAQIDSLYTNFLTIKSDSIIQSMFLNQQR